MGLKKSEKKKWYRQIIKTTKIKTNISQAKERFSEFLELPTEVVGKATKITAIEDESILIEGYQKIVDYYDNYIKIKGNNMDIIIDGKELDIKEITDSDLVIEGTIYSLNFKK